MGNGSRTRGTSNTGRNLVIAVAVTLVAAFAYLGHVRQVHREEAASAEATRVKAESDANARAALAERREAERVAEAAKAQRAELAELSGTLGSWKEEVSLAVASSRITLAPRIERLIELRDDVDRKRFAGTCAEGARTTLLRDMGLVLTAIKQFYGNELTSVLTRGQIPQQVEEATAAVGRCA